MEHDLPGLRTMLETHKAAVSKAVADEEWYLVKNLCDGIISAISIIDNIERTLQETE